MPLEDVLRAKVGGLVSRVGWVLYALDGRLAVDVSRPVRLSEWSPEELGLFDEIKAFLEVLPYREELRPFS